MDMATRDFLYRIEVRNKGSGGPRIEALQADVRALSMGTLRSARQIALYFVEGEIAPEEMNLLGLFLFSDPVEQEFRWEVVGQGRDEAADAGSAGGGDFGGAAAAEIVSLAPAEIAGAGASSPRVVEICRKPGVTDPVAIEIVRAAQELGVKGLKRAATGIRWELEADWLDEQSFARITKMLLANPVIERWEFGEIRPVFPQESARPVPVETYDIAAMDDAALIALSAERRLALDLEEMCAIRTWFAGAGRAATDVELEMIAQTWSEHCVHKTFKADVEVRGELWQKDAAAGVAGKLENAAQPHSPYPPVVHGIFSTYIKKTTEEIAAPWVRSAFVDNAGIVSFDGQWDISFKVETHNHPSAIEPFGGANTGVGGVIRDIMGVSARPIAVTDILCFGPPDMPEEELPQGSLHPRMIAHGVVAGVEDYGNKMGIPTVNGAIHFHPGYAANPLVYCGCVGLAPAGVHHHEPKAGDRVIVLGGRTGRDGIRGATFSSMRMDGSTGDVAGASVQIGDPIVQKRALDVLLAARDAGLYDAVTDCGAGGLSSAVGEMASELGADIELEKIGTKYPGLAPWEIWLSEAQERMVLAVPEVSVGAFAELCSRFGSEFWDIGSFRGDGRLVIRMRGEVVLDLPMEFVHKGIPQKRLVAEAPVKNRGQTPSLPAGAPQKVKKRGLTPFFKNVSCERIVRRYDHEVQGGTVVKPFAGPEGDAPQDAAVLKPQGTGGAWGIALSNALRPDYAEIDPYRAAWAAVDEAVRNAVAVGSDPERIAILDNFCMGDPNDPAVMWALLESARGLRDAALAFGTPIISGKDSFYNEYLGPNGRRHAVPPSLLVSAIGFVPDVSKAVTSFLKLPGDSIWLVGRFEPSFLDKDAAGAEADIGAVPGVDPGARVVYEALFEAMQAGEVAAAHDLSEGGLTLALAEMCMGGRKGADIVLPPSQGPTGRAMKECAASPLGLHGMVRDLLLYGESAGCLLVEVCAGQDEAFGRRFGEGQAFRIGAVSQMPVMRIHDGDSEILSVSISDMLKAWKDSAGEVLP